MFDFLDDDGNACARRGGDCHVGRGRRGCGRGAVAATLDHVLCRNSPRATASCPDVEALAVLQFHMGMVQMGKALRHAQQLGVAIPPALADPDADPTPEQTIAALRSIAAQFFPRLAPPT